MLPSLSVSMRYVLWLWRYELIFAAAIVVAFASAVCWFVQRYPILQNADNHAPREVQAPRHPPYPRYNSGLETR